MWRVVGLRPNGDQEPVRFRSVDVVDARSQAVNAAQQLQQSSSVDLPIERLLRDLESGDPLPGLDGVDWWGERAVDLVARDLGGDLRFGRVGETDSRVEIEGLTWVVPGEVDTIAFHWPEIVVADVSGLREVLVVDENDVTTPVSEMNLIDESSFDWRLYAGEGTHTAEGTSSYEAGSAVDHHRAAPVRLLASAAQLLIGRPLRWLGRPRKAVHDPSCLGRLRDWQERHPNISASYPDIGPLASDRVPVTSTGATLVAVHGTCSCAVPLLAQIQPLSTPAFRFEHDTFRSITENAHDLADAVRGLGPTASPVCLVGHSRGGLVARIAARSLTEECRVAVRTYGTPHLGTPFANAGARALKGLLATGRLAVNATLTWDPATMFLKTMLRGDLPEGLEVMRSDSEALRLLAIGPDPFEMMTYGADYDLQSVGDGVSSYTLGAILAEAFGHEPHDMVVPTASALAAGLPQPRLGCDHFSYFCDPDLAAELRACE